MIAFHGKDSIKKKYLSRVIAHQKADNLIRGRGWEYGKGCAVGCTLEDYDHRKYETELGIPEWLAKVEDVIFEGMSLDKSRNWPEVFLKAIKPGAYLEKAKVPFIVIVLKSTLKSMDNCKFDKKKNPEVVKAIAQSKAAVKQMIKAHEDGADLTAAESVARAAESAAGAAESEAGVAAESAARSAAWSAACSAESAAWAAAESGAWSAARLAAWSAAELEELATWSVAESAKSAAWSATVSTKLGSGLAAFDYYADELIKILKRIK